jgi:hypothetical protein
MPCQLGKCNAQIATGCQPTLWKQATVAVDCVLAKEPPISKLVVALEQLDTIALR